MMITYYHFHPLLKFVFYVEQLDDEPSYALDSPKYFEEDTLPYSIIIEEGFLERKMDI